MINLNSEFEMGMVATSVVVMLCMATWLFFRHERNGEKSLFLKTIDPFGADREQRSLVPLFLPTYQTSVGGILVVDDDPNIREFIRITLENSRHAVLEPDEERTSSRNGHLVRLARFLSKDAAS